MSMSLFSVYDDDGHVIPFDNREFDDEDHAIMHSITGIDYTRRPVQSVQSAVPQGSKSFGSILGSMNLSTTHQEEISNESVESVEVNEFTDGKEEHVDLSHIESDMNPEIFDHDI